VNLFKFMSDSPYLTFFLALILGQCVVSMVKYPLRCLNIKKHGWPPPHCDADGDFKENKESVEPDTEEVLKPSAVSVPYDRHAIVTNMCGMTTGKPLGRRTLISMALFLR